MILEPVPIAIAILGLAAICGLARLAVGPTVLDRMLAFDLIAVCGVAAIALLGIRWHTGVYLELLLVVALLGFLGTVALTFYIAKTLPDRGSDNPDGDAP